jgi:hypothetical protein
MVSNGISECGFRIAECGMKTQNSRKLEHPKIQKIRSLEGERLRKT